MAKRVKEIHSKIRSRLGYSDEESVKDVLSDWKKRTSTVCKPCWELKYCPYGPLVEQSPILPGTKSETDSHNAYLRRCLDTGLIGEVSQVDEGSRHRLQSILDEPEFAREVAWAEVSNEIRFERASEADDPFLEMFGGPLPPIEQYRVPFEAGELFSDGSIPDELRARVGIKVREIKRSARAALRLGYQDNRKPLDKARRQIFEHQLKADVDLPEEIPEIFAEASCNIFGHICPVFFVAESLTETKDLRRRGRYISFAVKMRVVRRDNHTCQECGIHLRDDEVEFDHIIPVSKGGSSEEHNIRLTCYDCNRDKSARVDI
jgi:hypothetical protein